MKKLKRFLILASVFITGQLLVIYHAPTYMYAIHGLFVGICINIDWFFED